MLLQCSYPCKFPASSIFSSAGWRYPVGTRSRFRWKLHPSSQAWPLLSTSNHGETAIAKCGNSWRPGPDTEHFKTNRVWWYKSLSYSLKIDHSFIRVPGHSISYESTLAEVMAWCRRPTIHYLNQWCRRHQAITRLNDDQDYQATMG